MQRHCDRILLLSILYRRQQTITKITWSTTSHPPSASKWKNTCQILQSTSLTVKRSISQAFSISSRTIRSNWRSRRASLTSSNWNRNATQINWSRDRTTCGWAWTMSSGLKDDPSRLQWAKACTMPCKCIQTKEPISGRLTLRSDLRTLSVRMKIKPSSPPLRRKICMSTLRHPRRMSPSGATIKSSRTASAIFSGGSRPRQDSLGIKATGTTSEKINWIPWAPPSPIWSKAINSAGTLHHLIQAEQARTTPCV